jgi:aspartyl-tRNA(Asn)/glutamyl-tRNA(Gln) amidotransferase subunit A
MLTVMAEPDPRDWTALPYDGRDYRNGLDDGVRGMRIAYSPDLGHAKVHPDVEARVKDAVDTFVELGAHVEQIDIDMSETKDIFRVHWYAGAARVIAATAPDERELLEEGLREVAAEGAGYDAATYTDAMFRRFAVGHQINMLLADYDFLMTPTLPIPAFEAGQEVAEPSQKRWTEWTPFSFPFNLTQHPAATCPCGFTSDGLPVGLQIVGPMYQEMRVMRAARAYESAHPFKMPEA